MKKISDSQPTLFDLDEYECGQLETWGWLEPDFELGSNKILLPNSPVREQKSPDILLPNQPVREQIKPLLPNQIIVKAKGRSYILTPTKGHKLLPKERSWYDVKTQKGHQYLYLRWRDDKTQRSRCLGRIDELECNERSI